jgi:hypothetical protein
VASYFQTLPDGREVFYPWGRVWGRGYVLNSQREVARLRFQTSLYVFIGLSSLLVIDSWKGVFSACGFLGVWGLVYALWMRYLLPKLKPYN